MRYKTTLFGYLENYLLIFENLIIFFCESSYGESWWTIYYLQMIDAQINEDFGCITSVCDKVTKWIWNLPPHSLEKYLKYLVIYILVPGCLKYEFKNIFVGINNHVCALLYIYMIFI